MWNKWFAWYPVRTVGGKYVWLKCVWYRRVLTTVLYMDKRPKGWPVSWDK